MVPVIPVRITNTPIIAYTALSHQNPGSNPGSGITGAEVFRAWGTDRLKIIANQGWICMGPTTCFVHDARTR